MKKFHYEQNICVAVADLPTHTKEYTPKQMMKFKALFQNELNRLQISWCRIYYDREENALFAYTRDGWKCVENQKTNNYEEGCSII